MKTLVLGAFRLYFKTLQRLAPRTAGRHAFKLFSTPRFRRPVNAKVEATMARAETLDLNLDGQRVAAYRWRLPADSPHSKTARRAMLLHGWESRASRLAVWVDPLLEAGFEVVAFDAPAHGESDGKRSSPLLFAQSAVRLAELAGPADVIVGHSLGALSSLIAVTAGEWIGETSIDCQRMVFVAGAESGVEAMGLFCRALDLPDSFLPLILEAAAEGFDRTVADFDGRRLMPRREIPTLWMHDPADDEAAWSAAEAVAAAAAHVDLVSMPGLGHHKIARDPEVIRRGVEFLTGP